MTKRKNRTTKTAPVTIDQTAPEVLMLAAPEVEQTAPEVETVQTVEEPAQTASTTVSSADLFDSMIAALSARMTFQRDSGNATQADKWAAEIKALRPVHIEAALACGIDVARMSQTIGQCVKTDESFVAIYAMQKVRKLLDALAQRNYRIIDGYTQTVLSNAFANEKLRNKTALVALSRSIEYSEFDQVQSIRKRYNCEPTTASTQASSSRKALQTLQCAAYERSDKALVMLANDASDAIKALFD